MITKNNEEITSLKDTINEEVRFYRDLYTSKSKDEGNISEDQNFSNKTGFLNYQI